MKQTLEIRLHGRGGQGGVTCAKILAAAYASLGKSIQTFGDYAGERSGAPVRAYARISDKPITNRNKVYNPDHLVVLDPTLLGKEVVSGLEPGGTLLINTAEDIASFDGRFREYRLATVDATKIARHHHIGTRSVVIVNTTIAGAFARLHDIPLDVLAETYSSLGLESNFDAAREAAEAVVIRPAAGDRTATAALPHPEESAPQHVEVLPIQDHLESRPSGLRTGSWSTQLPHYVEHLAPCSAWCPAGNDVVGFLQAMAGGGDAAAAAVLGRSTPLAGVCGRVCPAPCMEGCNRREYDGAVNIRALERWVADHAPVATKEVAVAADPRRVAIVGGGPAGLTAAYELAKAGHRAHIFEGEEALGGVLRTGIPVYRLPREVVDQEIDAILALGVMVSCGEFVDAARIATMAQEHDAVILATGLQKLRGLDVPGADLAGIEQGIRFLHRVNMRGVSELSGHVVVLGGGNTAMDCARSALRAGAESVTVAYRRTHLEMPAIREEIEEAEQEGVKLLFQRQPVAFAGNGHVTSIELAEVEMGEPDDTGRRRPVVSERRARFDCDHVLLALGQSADLSLLPASWELRDGRILADGRPTMVFAAGDLGTGDGTVTHAIGSGRRAASLALEVLGALAAGAQVFERPDRSLAVPVTDIRLDHFARSAPDREELMPAAARARNFDVVSRGLRNATEAHRCFSCGHCTECDTCLVYCPEGIIHRKESGYDVDYTYCKGCGICVEECPRNAMEMRSK